MTNHCHDSLDSLAASRAPVQAGAMSSEKYGFYDRLSAEFPSQVIIDTTELCNLACVHCAHPEFKKSDLYGGRTLDPALNDKAVDEVRMAGKGICQYLRYTGEGEPLIHPSIFEMVGYAVRHSGTTVTITTNGTLNKGDRLEKLMATGIDIVDISIDAYSPEVYAKIRVGGDLHVTRENVLRLIRMSKVPDCKTKIVVSYIEQAENQHETADFEKYWTDHGADYVIVRRLHSNAGALVDLADRLRIEGGVPQRRPCLYPWERITLNPRGLLAFCPVDWVQGSVMADYRTATIAETWRSEEYTKLREAHLTNHFTDHPFCGQCPDWALTRWPSQGRSYADMVQEFKERE